MLGVSALIELKKEQERFSISSEKGLILNIRRWKMLLDNWKKNVPAWPSALTAANPGLICECD